MISVLASASEWSFRLVGWPVWLVLPLAVAAFVGIRRLQRTELGNKPQQVRKGLMALRGATAAFIVLLLLEPTCQHPGASQLPTLAVFLDTSGSMAVKDATMSAHNRLNEAVALGLVPARLRDTTGMDAARAVERMAADLPVIANALVSDVQADEALKEDRRRAAKTAVKHSRQLRGYLPGLAGREDIAPLITSAADLLASTAETLEAPAAGRPAAGDEERGEARSPRRLAEALRDLQQHSGLLARKCMDSQRAADAALVGAAEEGSPVAAGLAELDKMTRFERARRLAVEKIAPAVAGRGIVKCYGLDRGLQDLDSVALGRDGSKAQGLLMGLTDLAGPLAELAARTAESYLGGVLILSDGRQTAGGDPVPAARALQARGARVAGIVVGDPETPRDAVVGEVIGSTDVFRGETIRLDVRFRISGFGEMPWDLLLNAGGEEIERREVRGTGQWQQERFEFPATEAGGMQVIARLEPRPDAAGGLPAAGVGARNGMLREYWTGAAGSAVTDLTRDPRFPGEPSSREEIEGFEGPANWADNYGARYRGFVVPPQAGSYTFWISSDDASELWLSTDGSAENKTLIASVNAWTAYDEWNRMPSQQSAPISLRAGQRYYIEALHKEGGGGDHLTVRWQLPDSTIERPIPAGRLLVYDENARPAAAPPAEEKDLVEASLDNNQAQMVISVNEDPLRVLLVDTHPRWESRYLMTMFDRDKRIELVRRFRAVWRHAKSESGDADETLLPREQKYMDAYDLLVLGDLMPEELDPEDQQRIADFVAKRGGFLIVLAGPRAMPSSYNLGGIADVLPVRNLSAAEGGESAPDRRTRARPAGLVLTEAGGDSPVTAVLDDPVLNIRLWPALPRLHWVARDVVAKPAASVLLQTDEETPAPVVATARFGAGRVLYIGTDESWRWRDRLGDRVHQAFWLQALRWGLGARLRGTDPRLQACVDRTLMDPEERAEARARARLSDGTVLEKPIRLTIERLDENGDPVPGTARDFQMSAVKDGGGIWQQEIPGAELEQGRWRLSFTADHPELVGIVEERDVTVVKRQGREGVEFGADLAALTRIAEAGGLRAGTFAEADSIAAELAKGLSPRSRTQPMTWSLWDNYSALFIVLALLMAEWIWRKRIGLP